jgi:hypothetical protein
MGLKEQIQKLLEELNKKNEEENNKIKEENDNDIDCTRLGYFCDITRDVYIALIQTNFTFQTKFEAQNEYNRRLAEWKLYRISEEINGDVNWMDWEDETQEKYFFYFICSHEEIAYDWEYFSKYFPDYRYFKSKKDCEKAISMLTDHIKRYLKGEFD